MADFENQGSEEDVVSIGADTTDLAAASQQITELANAFDRLAAATSAVSAAGVDPETGVIDPEKVNEAAAALKTLKEFSSDARKEIFSIGAVDLSELSQELEDISRKMDLVSRAADRLRTVASDTSKQKARVDKQRRDTSPAEFMNMSPEAMERVDEVPLREAQEEIRRLRGELAVAASRRSGFSASSPRRAQETIDRTVRERRDAAIRREEEELRSRIIDAESDVRRDPEITSRATKPLTRDEQEAARRVKEREERAKKLSDALRKANEASRRAQEEEAALHRQESIAERNRTAWTEEEIKAHDDRAAAGDETFVAYTRKIPGPGPEALPKIRAEIAAKKAEVEKARKERVELSRALGELLSSDPMEGLSLPSSSVIDTGKLKTEVRKKLLAAFSAKIKEETKSEPTEEMIKDFKKIINQEQTGAVDRIVRDIVSERASRSPLFERGMSTRAERRSSRTTSAATGPASGLASEDKFPQVDASDLAQRLNALEERKKRLQAEKEKNKSATETLESAIETLVKADREADPEPKSTEIDEYTEDLKELDADRRKIARKPIGLRPTGEEFQKRIEELSVATVPTYDKETGEEITREVTKETVEAVTGKKIKKKTREVVQRPLEDKEIIEMLEDEFDASQEEISEGLRSARERNQRAKNISEAQLLAKTLVEYAKRKMYQISGTGIDKTEQKTLQETIEGIIRSEGVGVSKDDLALLEKFGVASETIDAASGDTGVLEKIGYGREKKGTPNRPGAQRPDEVEKTGKLQQLLLDAEKEAMETGQDIGVVLANMLAAAEDRQREIDAQIAAHQQDIAKLKEIQDDSTSAQGGAYFRAIGLPEGRIGRTDPLSRVAGRKIGPDQQEAINERARKIAARYPGGLEAMHADVLTLNPEFNATSGESPRGLRGGEQFEGTVTRREIAENPLTGLFRNRTVAPNTGSDSGAQLSTPTISPTQAGPALEFMKELFASLKIVMAGMAETLSQGRAIKPSDVQDLGVNLSILANLYDQIQGMDPGTDENLKKIIADMKANFAALAEGEDIAKLFSPGFVTERLGKSAGLSRTEKEGLALEVAGIARGVSAGGERVVGGMQTYSEAKTRATTGVYGGKISATPAPVDSADAAEQIKQLAGKIQLAEGEDKQKLKEQLVALIGNQISEAEINPEDLLQLVKDPEIQKAIRDQFSRKIAAYKLETVSTPNDGEQVIGYQTEGKKRVKEGTREVIDPTGQTAAAALAERILSVEEVVARIAEDIDAIFSKDDRESSQSKREESELLIEERSRQLEIAEKRLKQVEDRLRLQAFLAGREAPPPTFGTDPGYSRLKSLGNVSEEIQERGALARNFIIPSQQRIFETYKTKPEVGSQEEILSKFTRIEKVEDLKPFGEDATAALGFRSLPISLVRRLIRENPELKKLETPSNPIEGVPSGGILKVSEEAARAVLEALEKVGVRISVGSFSNPEEPDSQSLVSVMHIAEKLADDKFAAYVATGIAENVITSNTGGNALLNIQTPEFNSYPSLDGKVKEDAGGHMQSAGIVPSGVVRNIQLVRRMATGDPMERPSYIRRAVAHEYGHAITLPYNEDEESKSYTLGRLKARGIGEDQARSVSKYGASDYRELLAESYAIINGYTQDEGEEDLANSEGWAESLVPALIGAIEDAKELTKKRAKRLGTYAKGGVFRTKPAPAMTTGGLRGPAAGRGARAVADRATTDDLYGDTLENFGASFALQTSPEGAPEVTENTPGPGFSVGGLNKRNFNLLPSDMVPEEAAPGMSEDEIKGIEERNKQKKERFRVAVLQLMQENAAFIKRALAEGREIYFGTYFDTDAGKIALDISELIPYDPNDAKSEAAARAKALADATARNQQSVARVQPSPGKGRGTGFGFAVEPEAEDAFPRTGIPAGEDAMAGYRAWTGRRYTSRNLPDAPVTGPGEPGSPANFPAPSDDFDLMQKDLEETLASDPESALAKDNLRMLLEARGMEADAIARRVEEVIRGVAAHEAAADSESKKADTAEASAQEAAVGAADRSTLVTPREAEISQAEELGVSTEELATLTPAQTEGLIREKQERDMARNAKRDEERLKTAGTRAEAARKRARELDPRARLETPMEAQIDEGAEVGLSPDEAARVDPSIVEKKKKEALEDKIAELNAADAARLKKIHDDQQARADAHAARDAAAKKAKDDRAAAEAAAAETAKNAAAAAEAAASAAEDELGLFEDFTDEERSEEFYGDDESGAYEVLPEEKAAQGVRKSAAAERIIAAGEQETQAVEDSATASESRAEEVATAVEEQAGSVQGAPDAVSTGSGTEAAPGGGDSTGPQYAQAREELLQTLLAALGNEKAAYELADAFERVNANFFNQEKAVRDQILANLVAQLQSEEVKKSFAADAARLEEIQSGEAKKQLEALIAAGASQQEIANAVEYYEQQAILHYVNMAKQQAQEELNMREAQFRTTPAGMKINKKTGEYVNDRPSPLYGESSREGVMLRNAGFEMDPQLKAYTEAQLVLFEKLYAGIMDIASATATSPRDIAMPGGSTRPETEDEIRARLVAGNAAARAVIRGGATEGDLLAMAKDAAKTNPPNALTASSVSQLLDALTALGREFNQITGRFNAIASGDGVGVPPDQAAAEGAASALNGLATAAKNAEEEVKGNVVYSSGGGASGGKPPTATGGGMPPGDPDNDWRKIRAVVPDTEMISRGLKDLAALQNRFNELSPTILHVGDANKAFSKSLDESAKKSQEASEAIAKLTDTNVGALRAIKTQVSRAATFLVLQQLGREIGGVFEHLQSGVFQFNQVLENTTVGFNTLFANTLQARAAVGNALIPKLNEAGKQIGFMREQSVQFADAINYTKGAAQGMVDEIRNIANVTPFRFKPLVEAALKMKAFGFEATEIPGMINSISNAVAALGGEDEKIDRIAYALGQMNSAGRVYQNDMMQLANAGIAGYRMLSEKMLTDLTAMKMRALGTMKDIPEETAEEFDRLQGMLNSASFKKSFGSIDDMIRTLEDPKRAEGLIRNLAKRGFLIGSTAARAITEGMDKQYQGSADRLSRTMTGAISTIQDLSQNFMATAFQPLFASVRDTIVEIGQFMLKSQEITKFVDGVRTRMVAFMGTLADFGPALQAAGQIFLNIFVGGIGSALDKGTQFGSVITGIVANLGPGLRLIGDILTNDVGKGLVVATLAFSLFSKIIATNPLVATITLLVAAISGIAKAIEEDTLGVGTFVKMFIPSVEQLFKVIGDALGTIMQELSEGGLAGFIAGLSLAIDLLMPFLTIFLATLSVILKIITPFAKPLGIIIGLFLALKTAMMAYDLAGSLMGKVMNGIGGAWTKVNGAIDQQISKVKQTAAAYDELKKAKIEAEDYKTNDRGQYLDDKGRVTKDKSKAALNWGPGEKVNSYGMTETKGRAAQAMLDGRGFVPGLLAMERGKQQAMDYGQNMMGVRPEFGKGFHLSHGDSAMPHTEAVITNRGIEGTYGYLDQAESRLTAFRDANQGKTLTGADLEKLRDLEEAAKLKQEYSKAGVMRFAGLDEGKSVTGKADINKNAGAYSMDNMLSAITIQKQINWIINTSYKQIEEAGAEIAAINKELDILKKQMESGEITTEDYEARKQSALDRIQQVKAKPVNQKAVAVIGGLIEGQGGDATDLLDKSAAGRPINIPKGSAEAIKKLPDKTRNLIMARVLEAQAGGKAFLTDKELNDIVTGALGDARGKAALKAMTTGISGKIAQSLTNLYNKVAAGVPKQFKTIERGGGKTGLKEIDSRGGDYYYVNEETGMLSNRKVGKKELESRQRIKSLPGAGILGKIGGAVGIAGVAAGLASGASRLAGQVAPILSAPIIGPFMDMLPKEMTSILRQKAGPFQAMASGIGTAAGTALGQALIPIPGLGAALGGMIGGALAEFVGNAVDNAIAGSDIAKKKAAALLEEAQSLGFTPEQAKVVAMAKVGIEDGNGLNALFGNFLGAKNPLQDISDVYTTNENFNPMSSKEYDERKASIEAAARAALDAGVYYDREGELKKLDDDRAAKAAPGAFDRAQAEFMNSGMDAEMLARYSNVAPEDLFAKMQLLELQDAHKDELKSIEGKIIRREELNGAEQKLKNELDRLTAAAAASPLGMYGTLMDPKLFSPKQFTDNLDATLRRDQYNAEDVKAGVEVNGQVVTDGQKRSGFVDFSTLMQDVGIQGLTRDAGFGGKTADALAALGFDYSKVTRDTSNEEILQMMRETLRVGVQARIRGEELMPKVDMTLTRLEMMEEYGGEAGYRMFDETTGQRAEYQQKQREFQGMGGDARLGILQKFADAAIPSRTISQYVAPTGRPRGKDGMTYDDGTGTSRTAGGMQDVLFPGASMLTTAEAQELEKLTAAQKAMNDARYIGLTVNLKYRLSTAGQNPEEVAAGVAAEKAFAQWQLTNQTKLTAAVNAGKNATAEQLALIKEETRLRDLGYVQKNVELKIGDALQASEAAGLQITNKDLANNTTLVEILMAKQKVIDANGGAAMSSVMASVAEARAEEIVTDIKVKQIALEELQQKSEEAGRNATVAFAKWEANKTDANFKAWEHVSKQQLGYQTSAEGVQRQITALSEKAAKFLDDAAKANPLKLTKAEIDQIKKLIAKDPGSILGGDGGAAANKALEKSLDLLGKISSVASKAYDRMRKEQQRTHDEYIKQLDEQEKRINERYQQRSDIQTEENLQAQLQIAGLQMRSDSADPLEAAKSFYDAKQELEQFYIDQQRDAELKVVSDEKERYEKQFGDASTATQAIYDAAMTRLQSRFDFAQSVLSGDEKMAGKMNDALRMTMFGGDIAGSELITGADGEKKTEAQDAFNTYKNSGISIALQKQYKVQNVAGLYKKYTAIKPGSRTTAQKALITKYNSMLATARKESAANSMIEAVTGLTGEQDITMATSIDAELAAFESENRDAIAAALAAGDNINEAQEALLAELEERQSLAKAAADDALLSALGGISAGTLYNADTAFTADASAFKGGIYEPKTGTGLTYGGKAINSQELAKQYLKIYKGSTEESGLAATFANESIMAQLRYKDQTGKEYSGAGNILAYLTELVNKQGGGSLGISRLSTDQGGLYQYLMSLVSAKNTFTTAQKTAILAQRTLEQGLNDFEQATGVDINIANLAEADVTDKQFTEYFNALGKTFEDNAARDAAIQKMRDVLRDTYGQALLAVDVEQYAKFADSSDKRIGTLSGVANSLKDVMDQIGNVMSSPNQMTTLDKLLFGANFDPSNLSGANNPISNLQFGKTQIDYVTTAITATRDAFESSMNSIKSYASELSGPLGAFNQQSVTGADALTAAMGQTASSFSLATGKVNEYATALAAAAAARASLGVNATLATGLATSTTPTSATITAGANNTFNITVSNANNMDAQQLAAELARLIALQAGSSVK